MGHCTKIFIKRDYLFSSNISCWLCEYDIFDWCHWFLYHSLTHNRPPSFTRSRYKLHAVGEWWILEIPDYIQINLRPLKAKSKLIPSLRYHPPFLFLILVPPFYTHRWSSLGSLWEAYINIKNIMMKPLPRVDHLSRHRFSSGIIQGHCCRQYWCSYIGHSLTVKGPTDNHHHQSFEYALNYAMLCRRVTLLLLHRDQT